MKLIVMKYVTPGTSVETIIECACKPPECRCGVMKEALADVAKNAAWREYMGFLPPDGPLWRGFSNGWDAGVKYAGKTHR